MKFFISVFLCCVVATLSPAQSTGGGGTVYLRQLERGTAGYVITGQGAGAVPTYTALAGAGIGDFSGPAAATDNAIVRFDGVGGKTGQNSVVTIADTTGAIAWGAGSTASLTSLAGTNLLLAAGTAATGSVKVTNTTAATTTTTGSFTNAGGFGNVGDFINGGTLFGRGTTSNPASGTSQISLNGAAVAFVNSTGAADEKIWDITTTATSIQFRLVNDLYNNASAWLAVTRTGFTSPVATFNGRAVVTAGTVSTSTTSGSIVNAGGFGNAGAAYIGGNANIAGTATVTGNITAGANLTVAGVITLGGPVSPAPGSTGNAGMIIWDANYVYFCIAPNTWKRAALSAY